MRKLSGIILVLIVALLAASPPALANLANNNEGQDNATAYVAITDENSKVGDVTAQVLVQATQVKYGYNGAMSANAVLTCERLSQGADVMTLVPAYTTTAETQRPQWQKEVALVACDLVVAEKFQVWNVLWENRLMANMRTTDPKAEMAHYAPDIVAGFSLTYSG